MKKNRFILAVFIFAMILLSACKMKPAISKNELGYDFSPLILNNTRLDVSNLTQTTGDTDTFWFVEQIFGRDVWTLITLSDDHKELWFYSKTWLFDEYELDLFQETQNKVIEQLNKLYGEPAIFNADSDLILFDRSVDPHNKVYGATGIWNVSDHVEVRLFASKGTGNVGIYEPDSVDEDIKYYIQIDYRWKVEDLS